MDTWDSLNKECNDCTRCALAQTRRNVVFGVGFDRADVMLVGEGPGAQEDQQGEPFVGAAGKFLDDILSVIDLSRDSNCYIANIVKCRPPGNRDPYPEEQQACVGYLYGQINLVKPKILICLGRVAAKQLIDPEYRITDSHGKWEKINGIWMTSLYHPSALLRDPSKRPATFNDLMSIRQKMQELHIQ